MSGEGWFFVGLTALGLALAGLAYAFQLRETFMSTAWVVGIGLAGIILLGRKEGKR